MEKLRTIKEMTSALTAIRSAGVLFGIVPSTGRKARAGYFFNFYT